MSKKLTTEEFKEKAKAMGLRSRLTHEGFLRKFKEVNPNYNDIIVVGKFTSTKGKIECKCKKCGITWFVKAGNLIFGRISGCPGTCKHEKIGNANRKYNEEKIILELKRRGFLLLERYTERINHKHLVKCTCCSHTYSVRLASIINKGHGCPRCFLKKKTKITEKFLHKFFNYMVTIYGWESLNYTKFRFNFTYFKFPKSYPEVSVGGIEHKLKLFFGGWSEGISRIFNLSLEEVQYRIKHKQRGQKQHLLYLLLNEILDHKIYTIRQEQRVIENLPEDITIHFNTRTVCIAVNGRQHYDKTSKYYSKSLIKNDRIRRKFWKDSLLELKEWELELQDMLSLVIKEFKLSLKSKYSDIFKNNNKFISLMHKVIKYVQLPINREGLVDRFYNKKESREKVSKDLKINKRLLNKLINIYGLDWDKIKALSRLRPDSCGKNISKAISHPVYCRERKKRFNSITEASEATGVDASSICRICNGSQKQSRFGLTFKKLMKK